MTNNFQHVIPILVQSESFVIRGKLLSTNLMLYTDSQRVTPLPGLKEASQRFSADLRSRKTDHIMNNDKRLPIELATELIRLRNLLDGVSQISWSFSVLNKQNPIGILDEAEAKQLITAYQGLIGNVKKLVAE